MTSDHGVGPARSDFIREIVDDDMRTGRHDGRVVTRFPPEPNGYLHIGHAKSICLNFGIAAEKGARCNLRFDDTNPLSEDVEYVEAIERDVRWLGFSFGERALYASDYFDEMYERAEGLVKEGLAYVDDLSEEEIREYRGTLGVPGTPSPHRDRSVADNLALFRRMRSGEVADGACVLRARIDLAASNMKMRDPLLYRIRHAHHHRTGDAWPIYPMYDYAHPVSDAIEGITHSLCTLEFENNRPLYDWVIEHTGVSEAHAFSRPQQIEFARLNLDYTVLSKRRLIRLVEEGHVEGWDDPRLPTIAGMRRRGYRPEAIRAFAELIGVAKVNSAVDMGKLEYCVRDDLNWVAPRVMGVLRPLRVTVTSWPEGEVEQLTAAYFPPDVGREGERNLPFSGRILIDRDDFEVDPPAGYKRLAPGRTVRLRHGYCITCDEVVTEGGEVVEIRASHFPDSVTQPPDGVKVWGTIHWVDAERSVGAEVRLYDRLFDVARPDDDPSLGLNPASLEVVPAARMELSLATAEPGSRWQLERVGYFVVDSEDGRPGAPVLNRIVTLRDSWPAVSGSGAAAEDHAEGDGAAGEKPSVSSEGARTRPARRSRSDYRAEARNRDPVLAGRFARWPADHGLQESDADLLTADRPTGDLFAAAVAHGAPALAVARWIINEVPAVAGGNSLVDSRLTGVALADLVQAVESGAVAGSAAREVLADLVARGGDAGQIIAERGLAQVDDEGAIAEIVEGVLAANADKVDQYRAGKTALLGFFVGQAIKASDGRANPTVVRTLLAERLA